MAKDDSVVISVRLPESLLESIDARAEQERRPRGNLIRLLLEQAVEEWGAEPVRKTERGK